MNCQNIREAFTVISAKMTQNKDYLITLDQQNGDGDLGISMSNGFADTVAKMTDGQETDLGKLLHQASKDFNEAAPSSLGTIISFWLLGMAKELKGKSEISLSELAEAMDKGLELVMQRAGSKLGEKTILDSLHPAISVLVEQSQSASSAVLPDIFQQAKSAAAEGAENTRNMRSVHGRAAYYGAKSIGVIDGGAVVGSLIFTALAEYVNNFLGGTYE